MPRKPAYAGKQKRQHRKRRSRRRWIPAVFSFLALTFCLLLLTRLSGCRRAPESVSHHRAQTSHARNNTRSRAEPAGTEMEARQLRLDLVRAIERAGGSRVWVKHRRHNTAGDID